MSTKLICHIKYVILSAFIIDVAMTNKNGDLAKKSALGDIKNTFATPLRPSEEVGGTKIKLNSIQKLNFGQNNDAIVFAKPNHQVFNDECVDEKYGVASSKPMDWCMNNDCDMPLPRYFAYSPLPPPSPTESDFSDIVDHPSTLLDDMMPLWPTPPPCFHDKNWLIDDYWSEPIATDPPIDLLEQFLNDIMTKSYADQ